VLQLSTCPVFTDVKKTVTKVEIFLSFFMMVERMNILKIYIFFTSKVLKRLRNALLWFFNSFLFLCSMPHILIMTPDRVFIDQDIEEAILSTNSGRIGVLENHSPLLTSLEISTLQFKEKGESWISLALLGGFALIQNDFLTVLVNDAVLGSVLDSSACLKDVEKAQKNFDEATGKKEKIESKMQLMRTRAKLEASEWMSTAAI